MSTRIYIDQVSNLKWTEVKGHRIKPKLPNGDYSPPPPKEHKVEEWTL